jgi:hypothetical protein
VPTGDIHLQHLSLSARIHGQQLEIDQNALIAG